MAVRLLLARLRVSEEGIDILGFLSQEELTAELLAAKALVAPSLGGESFGMVLTRAFACATPVVAWTSLAIGASWSRAPECLFRPASRAHWPRRSRSCSPTSRGASSSGAPRGTGYLEVLLGRHRRAADRDLRGVGRRTCQGGSVRPRLPRSTFGRFWPRCPSWSARLRCSSGAPRIGGLSPTHSRRHLALGDHRDCVEPSSVVARALAWKTRSTRRYRPRSRLSAECSRPSEGPCERRVAWSDRRAGPGRGADPTYGAEARSRSDASSAPSSRIGCSIFLAPADRLRAGLGADPPLGVDQPRRLRCGRHRLFAFAVASARRGHRSVLEEVGQVRQLITMARYGLGVMRAPLPAVVAIFFQTVGWAFQLAAVWAVMMAFGIHESLHAAALVLLLMNIATCCRCGPATLASSRPPSPSRSFRTASRTRGVRVRHRSPGDRDLRRRRRGAPVPCARGPLVREAQDDARGRRGRRRNGG